MSKKKRSSGGGGSSNAWMATFSDLLTLMMTFFVLLLTMSSMDSKDVGAMQQAAGVLPGQGDDLAKESAVTKTSDTSVLPPLPLPAPPPVQGAPTVAPVHPQEGGGPLKEGVERLITPLQRQGKGWLKREPASIAMHIEGAQLFDGEALNEYGRRFIAQIAAMASRQGATLSVEVFWVAKGDRWARERAWQVALSRADAAAQMAQLSGLVGPNLEVSGYGWPFGQQDDQFVRYHDLVRITIKTPMGAGDGAKSSKDSSKEEGQR